MRLDCGLNLRKPRGSLTKPPARTSTCGSRPLDQDLAVQIGSKQVLIVGVQIRSDGWKALRATAAAERRRSKAPAAEHCRRWPISVLPGLIRAGEGLGRLSMARVTHLCQARGVGRLGAARASATAALRGKSSPARIG